MKHFFVIFFLITTTLHPYPRVRSNHWDWSSINTHDIYFEPTFLWGAASSAQQIEGGCVTNSWSQWEQTPHSGKATIDEPCGIACDFWHRYHEDIKIMQQLGLTAFRMSIEWSRIEPTPGCIDQAALDHYKDICKELVAHGIKPVITLHHFTDPVWFLEKSGFELRENSRYFVRFCSTVFAALHEYVYLWLTFNSPTSYVTHGYARGERPPGKKDSSLAKRVLGNILNTHVDVYRALKSRPGGSKSRIGFTHNIFQVDPKHRFNPIDQLGSRIARSRMDEPVFNFFTTGKYPHMLANPYARSSLDFIGLNYYSHGYVDMGKLTRSKHEIAADNEYYSLYAEGLYRAIRRLWYELAQPLHIPIYVTENGFATTNETDRKLFYERYLYALSLAKKDGFDVRGYITWSFMDCYSWGTYRRKYGLIPVDRTTLERGPLRAGAQYYIDTIRRFSGKNNKKYND